MPASVKVATATARGRAVQPCPRILMAIVIEVTYKRQLKTDPWRATIKWDAILCVVKRGKEVSTACLQNGLLIDSTAAAAGWLLLLFLLLCQIDQARLKYYNLLTPVVMWYEFINEWLYFYFFNLQLINLQIYGPEQQVIVFHRGHTLLINQDKWHRIKVI